MQERGTDQEEIASNGGGEAEPRWRRRTKAETQE